MFGDASSLYIQPIGVPYRGAIDCIQSGLDAGGERMGGERKAAQTMPYDAGRWETEEDWHNGPGCADSAVAGH